MFDEHRKEFDMAMAVAEIIREAAAIAAICLVIGMVFTVCAIIGR